MAVRIRLTRVGATKRPSYRVVAIDSRKPRDGRALEILGFYDPLTEPATVQLQADRIRDWIGRGATPSDMVVRLLAQAGLDARGGEAKPAEAKPAATKPAAKPAAAKPAEAKSAGAPKPRARKAAAASGARGTA